MQSMLKLEGLGACTPGDFLKIDKKIEFGGISVQHNVWVGNSRPAIWVILWQSISIAMLSTCTVVK